MKRDMLDIINAYETLLESQTLALESLRELFGARSAHWGLLGGHSCESVRYWLEYVDKDFEPVSLDIDVPLHIALPESDIEREVLLDYVRMHPECIADIMGTFLHDEDSDVPVYPWQ